MAVGVARLARSGNREGRASSEYSSCTGPSEVVREGVRLRGSKLPGEGGEGPEPYPSSDGFIGGGDDRGGGF